MSVLVRILKKTHPQHTGGAYIQSPARLISGTAVPALTADVSTAGVFSRESIIVSWIFASADRTKRGTGRIVVAKARGSKRARKASESRKNFGMMPAYAAAPKADSTKPVLLRAVNTSLATKVQEEMSEFEREYPW